MITQSGHIIGMDSTPQGNVYRVLLHRVEEDPETCKTDWKFAKAEVNEEMLIKSMLSGKIKIENAEVCDGKLRGRTGALSRFNQQKGSSIRPMVIISQIVTVEGYEKLIGYKVAYYDGTVKNVKLNELLIYCQRMTDSGKAHGVQMIPIQNAMFIPSGNGVSAHIKGYEANQFYTEKYIRNVPKNVKPSKVNYAENKKNVSKLDEVFTKDQIKELKLGKEHGVDIRYYGNNKLSPEQMREIRKALENGVNPRLFADPAFKPEAMKAYRIQAKYGVDISKFINPEYNAEQIFELSTALISGVDLTKLADPKKSAYDMSKDRIILESKIWKEVGVSVIALMSTFHLDD